MAVNIAEVRAQAEIARKKAGAILGLVDKVESMADDLQRVGGNLGAENRNKLLIIGQSLADDLAAAAAAVKTAVTP